MNLANKLTVFRVVLVPVFVVFILTDFTQYNRWIAFAIFCIATITDKLLVSSALICLCSLGEIPAWIIVIIIAREFVISGIRLVASDNGVTIAASWWGKLKTISQMTMIIIMLLNIEKLTLLCDIVMYISLALTVISMVDYIIKNKKVLVLNTK